MPCMYEAEFTTKCALKRNVGLTRLKMVASVCSWTHYQVCTLESCVHLREI